jgi:6-pyruvoyl-tetrahydropterin synthase
MPLTTQFCPPTLQTFFYRIWTAKPVGGYAPAVRPLNAVGYYWYAVLTIQKHRTGDKLTDMYRITHGIFISFAHHIRGHSGPCISLHGHTWKFEVTLGATELDNEGFVVDFGKLREKVLNPCHTLLDHSLAMGEETWTKNSKHLTHLGEDLVGSRMETLGNLGTQQSANVGTLLGARNEFPGGIKVTVFPFNPTSERLAKWLFDLSREKAEDDRVRVAVARIYESLHPTESIAEYNPDR